MKPNTILNTQLNEDTFAYHHMKHLADYAADHEAIGPEEANACAADLRDFDRAGRTFFSYTQYLYSICKPE